MSLPSNGLSKRDTKGVLDCDAWPDLAPISKPTKSAKSSSPESVTTGAEETGCVSGGGKAENSKRSVRTPFC